MKESFRKFIRDHAEDDLLKLLLNASRYQEDVKMAVVQIKARKQLKDKLPEWHKNERLIFPSTSAAEQCSSETTAIYKKRLVQQNDWLCDLTGGLGVDTYYFSQKVKRVTYLEKNKVYCDAAEANFQTLGTANVHVINGDAIDFLKNKNESANGINVFYIDPSRRGKDNRRLFAISDCEPNLKEIMDLLPMYYKIIIKLSPMLDVSQVLKQIPSVCEVHILSIKNECKELLLVAESAVPPAQTCNLGALSPAQICKTSPITSQFLETDPIIFCVNYTGNNAEQSFCFRLSDERGEVTPTAKSVHCPPDKARDGVIVPVGKNMGRFLYEPNASILKAGAFKSVVLHYGVVKLHTNSHLYTSNIQVTTFPSRIFEITDILPFNNRICKTISSVIPKANISVRNFPLVVEEIRKRTRISEGGDIYLFATTLADNQKVLIKCSPLVQ